MAPFLAGVLSVTLALLLIPSPVDAQKNANGATNSEDEGQIIDDLVTAYRLVEFGEKNKAPEALITAASLFRKIARVQMDVCAEKPEITTDMDETKNDLVDEDAEAPDFDLQAKTLFAQALLMGNELKLDLGPLVNNAKNRTEYRHPIGGPKSKSRFIGPHQHDTYHFKLQANAPTNFGFSANVPMRVSVVRNDTNTLLMDRTGIVGSAAWRPQSKKGGPVGITVAVRNPARVRAKYHFWLK